MGNPYIIVEDFRAGLDSRKMAVTSPPGSLQTLTNGHITRGGEIEKAQAFTEVVDLLADNTFGLASSKNGFFVFGSNTLTGTYTNNVILSNPPIRYAKMPAVASGANMEKVLSTDRYNGRLYVIALYDDGVIHHFYDDPTTGWGEVTDWFSNQGRAKFTITGGDVNEAVAATGSLDVTGGFVGSTMTDLDVNSVNILSGTVTFISGDTTEDFIQRVVDNINAYSGTSGYTASWVGDTITITAVVAGSGPNGYVVAPTVTGTLSTSNINNMSGGVDASEISDITVNATTIVDTSIDWAGSDTQTASAVVAAINNYTATSGYIATSIGNEVTIIHQAGGVAPNGHAVAITKTGSVTITPSSGITIENGSASAAVYEPGRFAKTIGTKMYILSGPNMHYSEVDVPTNFNSGTGAGFDNLSTNSSGSETLQALAKYFGNIAIFSEGNVHIWFVDPDPTQNSELQVLNNTGTISPKSVIEFGDNDVFYLSISGIRSLRARDSSNAAFVNDVGVAIDATIQELIREDEVAARAAAGILEPRESRYMLAIGSSVFVFSFFTTSKVTAWSKYSPGFTIDDWAFMDQIVLCRTGDSIFRLGGEASRTYDATAMTVVLPFLNGGTPAAVKTWTGIDIACEGDFDVYGAFDPLNPDTYTKMASISNTTYSEMKVAFKGKSTHVAIKLVSKNSGYARIGNIAIHYREGHSS